MGCLLYSMLSQDPAGDTGEFRQSREGSLQCLGWIRLREMAASSLSLAAPPGPPSARDVFSASPPWSSIQALLCVQKD